MGEDADVGKDWREERGTTKEEMIELNGHEFEHHQLNGHEFEWTLGDGEGQGNLACYSPWGSKSWTWLSRWMTTTRSGDFPDHTSAENAPCRSKESYVKGCFTQTPFWENPSCLSDMCLHMGRLWDVPNMANQNDWPKENQKKCPIKIIQTAMRDDSATQGLSLWVFLYVYPHVGCSFSS